MDVALRIAYDGRAFDSYARQPGRRTVEGALLDGLNRWGPATLITGSRTDAGVSAAGNVVKVSTSRSHARGLLEELQATLPAGLRVLAQASVATDWNPRHAAWRRYAYHAPADGLDVTAMRRAAKAFVGTHDVRAFARLEPGRTPLRTVEKVRVRSKDGLVALEVQGPSFLWNQVRRMAGALLAVGRHDAPETAISEALVTGAAHPRFGLAPPEGLLLVGVHYPGLRWTWTTSRWDGRASAWTTFKLWDVGRPPRVRTSRDRAQTTRGPGPASRSSLARRRP